MQDRKTIRRLWRLADRLSRNASHIRNARLPHHLKPSRARLRRHLLELDQILGRWKDDFTASRRRGRPDIRLRPSWSPWLYRRINKRRRENALMEAGYSSEFVERLSR